MAEPYYQDELVTLYHGDCHKVLADMKSGSVDCVITDPPYADRTHAKARTSGAHKIDFSPFTGADLEESLVLCGRLTRRWVVATLDYTHAFEFDAKPPPGLRSLRIGVWVKPNPMPQLTSDRPGQGWEAILFMHREDVKPAWSGGGRSGVWVHPVVQNMGHPTSKHLPVVSDWVRLFTEVGNIVLDPFAGSGTTLRAAKDEGRRAIGVEVEERYCEIAARRLAQDAFDFGGVA